MIILWLYTHSWSQGDPGPRVDKRQFLTKKNTVNYISPDRQGEVNRHYTPQKLRKIYLQQIHNSAVQSLARHNFRTTQHLSRNIHNSAFEPTYLQINNSSFEPISPLCSNSSAIESTLHSHPDLSFSKLLFLEPELKKLLNALHLEVDLVGRWKIAASYYQKTPPINPRSA